MDLNTQQILHISSDAMISKLKKLHLENLWDFVMHLPLRYEDNTHLTPLSDLRVGERVLVEATVTHQEIQNRPRRQLIASLSDSSHHTLFIRFLHIYPNHLKLLATGNRLRVAGEVRQGFYGFEMVHPTVHLADGAALAEHLTPVYPTVAGVHQNQLRRYIQYALEQVELIDTLPENLLQSLKLPSFADTVQFLHAPPPEYSLKQLNNGSLPAWQRLKFDELLAQQLSMQLARNERAGQSTVALKGNGKLTTALEKQLPFALTNAQKKSLHEIRQDLSQSHPMHRLLQGDVGSGKTIVAAMAALIAVESGFQVALMAPTEILAEQHFAKLQQWLTPLNIRIAHLSGSLKKKEKDQIKSIIASGEAQIAVGTHALFQKDVIFNQLGLVIVDEQHRFGVAQRLALKNKGHYVHQLMMSATPIPRSLAMGFFADLDISIIDELPPGRQPIETKLIRNERRPAVEQFVRRTVSEGKQAYWVCPLIEESETLQLKTATETYENLVHTFPDLKIGLVHGRMKPAEKNEVMAQFLSGCLNILVATTVIEVGVDVPNAVLMVIEHAERMGLSQLHQLRGRVGRGGGESTCILLFDNDKLTEIAKSRLKIIYENTDGFEIARLDLNLRGPGEFLGARQSGVPLLRFANFQEDIHLLEHAQKIATQMIEQNLPHVEQHLNRWLPQRDSYLGV